VSCDKLNMKIRVKTQNEHKNGKSDVVKAKRINISVFYNMTSCRVRTGNASDEHADTTFRRVSCNALRNKAIKSLWQLISVHVFTRFHISPQVG
jgi:hypothetical protein